MPGIGIGLGLTLGGGGGALTDTAIARALAAKGLSDAQARAVIGGAASLGAGLRAVGLTPAAASPAPTPAQTPTPSPAPTPTPSPAPTPTPSPTPTPTPTPAPTITGFALNGSSNPALKAMLARVKTGAGRGRMLMIGDSTTVGDGSGSGGQRIAGARANRPSAVLASLLGAAGYPALDNSIYTANVQPSGATAPAYDPRLSLGSWTEQNPAVVAAFADFAGSGFFAGGASPLSAMFDGVDTFEVQVYNTDSFTLSFRIDGAVPAAGPATQTFSAGTGTTRVMLKAAATGTHSIAIAADSSNAALRSIVAYAGGTKAIDILCHAGCGQTSANLAATAANATRSRDQIAQEAADFAIILADFNDMNQGVSAAAHSASLGAIVDAQRASGDVLLVGGWRGTTAAFDNAAIRQATASVAAAKGIAYLNLDAYYGGAAPPDLYDNVHRTAAGYADVADAYRRCMLAMAGA